ncbi:hypothetical protein CapIbe_009963, partial [Capra ibex]
MSPEAGDPETARAEAGGVRGSWLSATLSTASSVPTPGAKAGRGGSSPAAPRASRTAARDCLRPRRLCPRLSCCPLPPLRRASPAESAALTSPARGAPSAAAGARPVPAARLPPQPAPPAPGSASRPRPLGAGASGQARSRVLGTRSGPLSGTLGAVSRLGRFRSLAADEWASCSFGPDSGRGPGDGSSSDRDLPTRLLHSAPCWLEAGCSAGRAPGSRSEMG